MSETFTWNKGDGGSFEVASNWVDATSGQDPSPRAPGIGDTANISTAGVITGYGSVNALNVSSPTTLTLATLDVSASTVTFVGNLALTRNSDLTATNSLAITDTTNMRSGASIHVTSGSLDVGSVTSISPSILKLSGPSTLVDVATSSGFGINIGSSSASPSAMIDVANGATLNSHSATSPSGPSLMTIGIAGGGGGLDVSGTGSEASASSIYLGNGGLGTVRITDGGLIRADYVAVGTTGYGLITRAGTGSVIVDGPSSSMKISGSLDIGGELDTEQLPDKGSVTIQNGAELAVDPTSSTSRPGAVIGDEAYGSGSLTVNGPGSTAAISNGLVVGYYGSGNLSILNGGVITLIGSSASDGLTAGDLQAVNGRTPVYSTGTISVFGYGSILSLVHAPLVVGDDGNANMTIANAGVVKSGTGSAIGDGVGGTGSVLVSGFGSQWINTGSILVGNGEKGSLTVSAGGTVSIKSTAKVGTLQVGANSGNGVVTVTGNQSSLSTGSLLLGASGTATLSVANFGHVAVRSLQIGSTLGSGSLNIGAVGAAVSDTGRAEVASGSVTLAGGDLSIGKTLQLDLGAVMSGTGSVEAFATINRGTIEAKSGPLKFMSSVGGQGTLQIDNGATLTLSSMISAGQSLVFAGGKGALDLSDPSAFAAHISSFAAGSVIDLEGVTAKALSFSGHHLTVQETNGTSLNLTFIGTYTSANFVAQADGHGGTLINYHPN
jgi:T5SS/PEP-CTERM-associated repeat protein